MSEPVLCYVEGRTAYFTTQELSEQWGDSWDAVPYEHNAGWPYEPYGKQDYNDDGTPKWEIVVVMFRSVLETPAERAGGSSAYSVRDINDGAVAWLSPSIWNEPESRVFIKAGTPLSEFKRLIRQAGGKVYVEDKE